MNKALRSALYIPANNPRALEKARGLDADAIILDLEDAVAPDHKIAARSAACQAIASLASRPVILRINTLDSAWGVDDLKAAVAAGPAAILLPKAGDAEDIIEIRARAGGIALWAMIETPRGVLNAAAIAAAGVSALVLGSNDLLKETGARAMPDRANLQFAMSQCVLAARAAGIMVLDGVHNALDDEAGFIDACTMARDFGFDGKTLVHPRQIAPCNTAFSPSAEEIATAQRIVAAFAADPKLGVTVLDGRMVEKLHADEAARILARAGL